MNYNMFYHHEALAKLIVVPECLYRGYGSFKQ